MNEEICLSCKRRNLYFCGDGMFGCNHWDADISECKIMKRCSVCHNGYYGKGYDAEPIHNNEPCCRKCKIKIVNPFIKKIMQQHERK